MKQSTRLLQKATDMDMEFRQKTEQIIRFEFFDDFWKLYLETRDKWVNAMTVQVKEQLRCPHCGVKINGYGHLLDGFNPKASHF